MDDWISISDQFKAAEEKEQFFQNPTLTPFLKVSFSKNYTTPEIVSSKSSTSNFMGLSGSELLTILNNNNLHPDPTEMDLTSWTITKLNDIEMKLNEADVKVNFQPSLQFWISLSEDKQLEYLALGELVSETADASQLSKINQALKTLKSGQKLITKKITKSR